MFEGVGATSSREIGGFDAFYGGETSPSSGPGSDHSDVEVVDPSLFTSDDETAVLDEFDAEREREQESGFEQETGVETGLETDPTTEIRFGGEGRTELETRLETSTETRSEFEFGQEDDDDEDDMGGFGEFDIDDEVFDTGVIQSIDEL